MKRFSLHGAGGSGPFETVRDWQAAFETKFPEVDLTYSSVGSGAGISALWGDIDCEKKPVAALCQDAEAPTAATLWGIGGGKIGPTELEEHLPQGLKQVPAMAGPVLLTYSKDVTGDLGSLTSKQLNMSAPVIAGIFNNSILYWDDIAIQADNPGLSLPSERITVVVRSDKSGMSETLTQFIKNNNKQTWPDEAVGAKPKWPLSNLGFSSESTACLANETESRNLQGNGQTGVGVSLLRRPFSIGYLELGYFSTLSAFVGQAHVSSNNNPTDFEPATLQTLRAAMDGLAEEFIDANNLYQDLVNEETPLGGYPISRYIYWYLKTSHQEYKTCYEAWLLYRFLQWTYADPIAEEIALGHGFVVPPKSVVAKANVVLQQIECVVTDGEAYGSIKAGDIISAATYIPAPYRDSTESELATIAPLLVAGVFLLLGVVAILRKRKDDFAWRVPPNDLEYHNPSVVIGHGMFGVIVLAEYRGTQVAVKCVLPPKANEFDEPDLPDSLPESDVDRYYDVQQPSKTPRKSIADRSKRISDFEREMRILSKLHHPCVATIMGAVMQRGKDPLLVMAYAEHGSLYDILQNKTAVLDGDVLHPILRDISQGVRFLHSADPPIIHGNLKASNILVDSKFRAVVSDFGLSGKDPSWCSSKPFWTAPELLLGNSSSTTASDVYSLGVLLYEIYSRKEPFENEDPTEVVKQILDHHIQKRPPIPTGCPTEVRSIMKDCWLADPETRPTAEEIDMRLKRLAVGDVGPGNFLLPSQQRDLKASRNEDLLFKLFPKHIGEALRDGRKVEPESKEMVSIFFSDVVGFTTIAASLPPEKISDMLDRLYAKFDELSYKHDVFKIETIGDAYVAVTNLVSDQEHDHAKRIATFSIEAIEVASKTLIDSENPTRGHVQIRVGFHSGPVIANIVGDTINVAARMESNSEPGRIHFSKRSADILKLQCPSIPLVPRGEIKVKGKDAMHTFWVNEE